MRLEAVLPFVGVRTERLVEEASAARRRKRRSARLRHQASDHKDNRAGKLRNNARAPGPVSPVLGCTPTNRANQGKTCGSIPDGRGQALIRGPCTRGSGRRPDWQTWNPVTNECDPIGNGTCSDTATGGCAGGVCSPCDAATPIYDAGRASKAPAQAAAVATGSAPTTAPYVQVQWQLWYRQRLQPHKQLWQRWRRHIRMREPRTSRLCRKLC